MDDRLSVLGEVEEYVPTAHITEELVDTLEQFQDTINNPSDEINIWVSGFFGSGKSSFAKVLGYLLANPEIGGKRVADRFFDLNKIPKAKALLTTIHSSAPTETVLLDLNTSPNVLQEGEPIVLPVYRTVLHEFGYSRDIVLAELEFELEGKSGLEEFRAKYSEVYQTPWESQRGHHYRQESGKSDPPRARCQTFPSADSGRTPAQTADDHFEMVRPSNKRATPATASR